ncbi:hypothetical protein PIB30_084807 [Stylosanthes scabra]|uniref:Secreted protein n=1 Tax=Stylosanthes scabra TaxID=79078 RepID=A0ABU6XT97_9FABA|nr:hypothetical protein [Stylosanthes scabra]
MSPRETRKSGRSLLVSSLVLVQTTVEETRLMAEGVKGWTLEGGFEGKGLEKECEIRGSGDLAGSHGAGTSIPAPAPIYSWGPILSPRGLSGSPRSSPSRIKSADTRRGGGNCHPY